MIVEQIKIDKYDKKSRQKLKCDWKLRKKEKNFFFKNVVINDIDRWDRQWIIYLTVIMTMTYTSSHFWTIIVM